MAEAEDLKSSKCGFDPHRGHHASSFRNPGEWCADATSKVTGEQISAILYP